MSQSNVIFAFLFAAFVVFITTRGELRVYLGFLLGGEPEPTMAGGGPDLVGMASHGGVQAANTSAINQAAQNEHNKIAANLNTTIQIASMFA